MMNDRYYKLLSSIALVAFLWASVLPAAAQDEYGVGATVEVPKVEPGTLVLDGVADEGVWDLALQLDALANWAPFGEFGTDEPDLEVDARVLWSEDTLYVYMRAFDNDLFTDADEPWQSDQFLIGIDPTHEGDSLYDSGFGGAPEHAPDLGPYSYKVWTNGITLNWGDVDPVAEGWANGSVVVDEDALEWGFEAAFYVPQIGPDTQIGFNIGGAQASLEAEENSDEGTYSFYSWQVCADPPEGAFCQLAGGNITSDARSFATLEFGADTGDDGEYGVGFEVAVPEIEAGSLDLDGHADEPEWDDALVVDALANWAPFGDFGTDEPDLDVDARVLWSEDTLYVYMRALDNDIFRDDEEPGQSDQFLIGIDPTHAGDDLYDSGFGGAPENAPDLGPYAYKVWTNGITLNWGDVDPVAEGWANGAVFVDEEALEWGFEAAFYVPQIGTGAKVGFNIGGGQASLEAEENSEEGTYSFYSWQVCADPPTGAFCQFAGGNVMSDARSFSTLLFGTDVGVEEESLSEVPAEFKVKQNYPNPFNPSTTIEYAITRAGNVQLEIFTSLGQKVATLVDTKRPEGSYRVTWEAGGLSSGTYLYQLRIDGDLVDTKTMTLIK